MAHAQSRPWIALHVFYGGNPAVLVRECIAPLVTQLEAAGSIQHFFFINYWLEGTHIRLRLMAAENVPGSGLTTEVVARIATYLRERPALHSTSKLESTSYYDELFDGEFGSEDRSKHFSPDGSPVMAQNNSVVQREYEPELGRYGGEVGMRIAEDLFEVSSRLAFEVANLGNYNARTFLLGIAAQVMVGTMASLLPDDESMSQFFTRYHANWAQNYRMPLDFAAPEFRQRFRQDLPALRAMTESIADPIRRGRNDNIPALLTQWTQACVEARARMEWAFSRGELWFMRAGGRWVPPSSDEAIWMWSHSILHMTNNRLMVSIPDEAYLALQLAEATER